MVVENDASIWEYQQRADDPDVSVVIATYPASEHSTVSKRLRDQNFAGDWEIIVINDADLNRSEARNAGIAEAKADIVAFTDDDTKPPEDWLSSIYTAFKTNPSLVCLEGRVTGGPQYNGEGLYVGCNMAARRQALLDIGGWDTTISGWREDTELGWRMETRAEGDCEYHHEVVMAHPKYPRTAYDRQREKLLRSKYPELYDERLDTGIVDRLWRYGQVVGIVAYINRLRNALHRIFT